MFDHDVPSAEWVDRSGLPYLINRRQLLRWGSMAAGALAAPLWPLHDAGATPTATLRGAPVKTERTYYSAAKVAAALDNIGNFAWAAALKNTAIARADALLAKGDDWLWSQVTTQGVPRSYSVNQDVGSPVTGALPGVYSWLADPLNAPWKLTDPNPDADGKHWTFPTNDFWAFYTSGLDASGAFDRSLADEGLLINTLYPEKGPTWGVDDGFGWSTTDANGKPVKYTFIAYYNHWTNYYGYGSTVGETGRNGIFNYYLQAVRDAYLFTGEVKYAHSGLIALDRIADIYPDMFTGAYRWEDGFLASDGHRQHGKIVGSIWEALYVPTLISAYDAFFPAIATADIAGVVGFLQAKSAQYGLAPKATPGDIRFNIENNLLREMVSAVKTADIVGNFGMHQAALALAAVVLDDPVDSIDMIDFVFQPGALVTTPLPMKVTGGAVAANIVNLVDRDGFGSDGAPGYDATWANSFTSIADSLDGYQRYKDNGQYGQSDLFLHPKYRSMLSALGKLVMLNRFTPPIGDSGTTGSPLISGITAAERFAAFARSGRAEDAQLAYLLNRNSLNNLHGSVFTDSSATLAKIQQVIEAQGPLDLGSDNLTGFGSAFLRDGTGDTMRGAMVHYGRNSGHGHADALNLEMWAHRIDLMPDHGYPEFADAHIRTIEWTKNTVAHNTVVVDAATQKPILVGQPIGFADGSWVKYTDTSARGAYPQTSRYRRTTAMIKIDDSNSYVFDVFRAVGGGQHDYSFHGGPGTVLTEGLNLAAQSTGTYAGPTIDIPADGAPSAPGRSGFNFLYNVAKQTAPPSQFSVDYAVTDHWEAWPDGQAPDTHLRATFLGEFDQVALCDGQPPRNAQNPNPAVLKYLLGRRSGNNVSTTVTAILEPYVATRTISSISPATVSSATMLGPDDVRAVKVSLANGAVDYVVHSLRPGVEIQIDDVFSFSGECCVYRLRAGVGQFCFSYGGSTDLQGSATPATGTLIVDPAAYTGAVTAISMDLDPTEPDEVNPTNRITVTFDQPVSVQLLAEITDRYVYIEHDESANAVYRISQASEVNGSVILDVGDTGLAVRYVDDDDPDAGFVSNVAVGASFRVPRHAEWSSAGVPVTKGPVSAKAQQINGTVQLAVHVKNELGPAADIRITTPWGSKKLTKVGENTAVYELFDTASPTVDRTEVNVAIYCWNNGRPTYQLYTLEVPEFPDR